MVTAQRPIRVVVVEDDDDSREVLSRLLRGHGHEVKTFAHANGGVAPMTIHDPHVALLDVRLPGRSGDDLARELAQQSPHTRIIFLTGEENIGRLKTAVPASMVIRKPVDFAVLLQLLSCVRDNAMSRISAGLLMFRRRPQGTQVLLVHPGGPFFRNKHDGAWSIPKGEAAPGEDVLATAKREFEEELGSRPSGRFVPLAPVKQKGGKTVHAWAVEGDLDTTLLQSNTFKMEWPPKSGKRVEFPEVDRAEFFDLTAARKKINAAQVTLLDALTRLVEVE